MKPFLCRLGWHRPAWIAVSYMLELWGCRCGRVVLQFADDRLAMSEVEAMNEWLKKPSAKVDR